MNSSNKHSDIKLYGSITIIPQFIPPKFQFITLTRHCVFSFRTFPNSDRAQMLTQGTTLYLKTPREISAWSNGRIGWYVQYYKFGQL
jgi:hypothetical protein